MAFQTTGSDVLLFDPFETPADANLNLIYQQDSSSMNIPGQGHSSGGVAHATNQTTRAMLEDEVEEVPGLRKPTRSDWREIEPVIASLYRSHTLEEVKRRLEEDYRLHVTTKMLKDKRRNWKLDKNIKPQEMKAMIRKKVQRERIGKASVFRCRGKAVPNEKISRHVKATKRSVLDEILARAPTPPELICYTPLASPLTTPRVLENPEIIAKMVQNYIHGSLDAGIWVQDGDAGWFSVKGSGRMLTEFYNDCIIAINSPAAEDEKETWLLLGSALAHIEDIVDSEDPYVLPFLFHVVQSNCLHKSTSYLASELLKQFSAMSDAKLPPTHPFNQIFSRCLDVKASGLSQICNLAISSQVDGCSKRLGRFDHMTLDLQKYALSWGVMGLQGIETLSNVLREVESELSPSDRRALGLRLNLAAHHSTFGCFHKAIETIQILLAAIPQCPRDYRDRYLSEGLYQLARAQKGLSETEMAEQNIRQAIQIGACAFGRDNGCVLQMMLHLEAWLRDWGIEDDAGKVRMDIDGVMKSKQKRLAQQDEERWRRCKALNPSLATPPLSKRHLHVTMGALQKDFSTWQRES